MFTRFRQRRTPAAAVCTRQSTKGIRVHLDSRGLIGDGVVFDEATSETKLLLSAACSLGAD